ncbi:small nuclear ribonucleoprotein D2 [Nematocida displodere]|uniref:Small nuclear ribonucleoprotein D2 n=1 Tax=Nematocida displodere TaxID=1805483 RepID=A0A177EDS5_9MICR|nr:small nuclear ribonucleoprotein D2 [Nematocida displodere]
MEGSPLSHLSQQAKTQSRVVVINRNGRRIEGVLCAADKHFNLLLRAATETRVQEPCGSRGKKRREAVQVFTRDLGNVFIRGDTVIAIHENSHDIET